MINSSLINKANVFIGCAFFATITLQLPIAHFFVDKLYLFFFVFGLLLSIVQTKARINAVFFYIILIFLCFICSIFSQGVLPSLYGFIFYIFTPLFLYLYFSVFGERKLRCIYITNIFVASFVAIGAWYQIVVDPLLFGIYSGTSFDNFSNFGTQRAASFLGSTQAYASYILFSIVFFDHFKSNSNWGYKATCVFWLISGLLSGSLGFIIGFLLYISCKFIFTRLNLSRLMILKFSIVLLSFLVFVSFIYIFRDYVLGMFSSESPVYRVLSYLLGNDSIGLSSGNDVRIQRWLQALDNGGLVIFGQGIGSTSSILYGEERLNFESYLFTLYYEGGALLLFGYIYLLISILINRGMLIVPNLPVFLVLMFYSLIVHTFFLVNQVVVWVLIVSLAMGINHEKENSDKCI